MRCKRFRKMIADYVNELSEPEDNRLIQEHLAECDPCREELNTLRKLQRLISDVKVEYPSATVWKNFVPDLHKRIASEAALAFKKQQKQRLYLLPGWAASAAAIVLIFFASAMLKYYPITNPIQPQRAKSIEIVEDSSTPVSSSIVDDSSTPVSPSIVDDSSEPTLVAGVISKVLITESEAAELKKLESFIQSERLSFSYYHDDLLVDVSREVSYTEDDEGTIQFLLESEFSEFSERPTIESDSTEFGAM